MSDIVRDPRAPFITTITPRDGALSIRWTYLADTLIDTDETFVNVWNKTTDNSIQIYIPSLTNGGLRIPNLENNVEYIVDIVQTLISGEQLLSNSVSASARKRPDPTLQITSVDITEAPDAKFRTVVHFRLYDMLYADALIRTVNIRLIDEFRNNVLQFLIPEGTLLKNLPDEDGLVTFQEFQSFTIETLGDGTYVASASLSNAYGTSLPSENFSFIVKDMPNNVTDVEVLSGLDNAVQVKFKCIESVMVGFNIRQFLVRYFKTSDPTNVMTKIVSNVDSNNVALYAPSTPINGNVIIDALDNVEEYQFSVVAVNKRGESTASVPVRGWAGLPDDITNVQVNYVTNTTLDASWTIVSKNYRLKTLKYAVMQDNVEIKTGNLGVNDVSLTLNDMNLLDGESVKLKLKPYYDVPLGFVPHTGVIMPDGLYSLTYVVESLPQLVYAKCDILFATSGVNTQEVKFVGKVHSSGVTAMEFQTKLKTDPESPWVVVGTIIRSDLVVSGSNLIGTLTVSNVALGQYDVRTRAVYGANSGPLTGLEGKVTSLDLPKILSVDVVKLSEEILEVQIESDSDTYPDNVVLELFNNPGASGVSLETVVLSGAGAAVVGNTKQRTYSAILNNIVPDSLVYVKCSMKRNVDLSYYFTGDNAPVAFEGSITYNSFIVSDSRYVACQGDVSAQSGASAQIDAVIQFPFNPDKWNRVKEVVLQRTSDNITWDNVNSFAFVAETAEIVDNKVVISVLDISKVNGTMYTYRAYNVPLTVRDIVHPKFDETKYASALPFLAVEVSSVGVNAEIDENDYKVKINADWNITPGTYTTYFDVFVYSIGRLIGSKNKQSGTTATFALDIYSVCEILDLVPSDNKNAAELLFNKNITFEVVPYVQVPNSDNLVFISKFTKQDGYLTYSGATSLSIEPVSTPNPVTSVTLLSLSSNSATFSFVKPLVTQKKPLTKFVLEVSLSVTFSSVTSYDISPESNELSYQQYKVSDLDADTTYYYRIRAANLLGYSRFLNGDNFHTPENIPSVSPVTVGQNVNDSLPTCDITFMKINSTTYTVQNYILSVFNSTTNVKIGEDITLLRDVALPYTYTGEFSKSYKFKVVAKMTNSLNEPIDSLEGVSQPITICDKPIFHTNPVWSNVVDSVNSQVSIVINPKGSDSVTLILMALPSNTDINDSPVFTPPTPTVSNDGLYYYYVELPYQVNTPPKFIAVVSNIKGSNYVMGGF